MRKKHPKACSIAVFLTFALTVDLIFASLSTAQYVQIYGGPISDNSTISGFQEPMLPINPGSTAGLGIGVGYARKYTANNENEGLRAVLWNASGTIVELDNLGISGSGTTNTIAYAVNSTGIVVGTALKFESGSSLGGRAARWNASGSIVELDNLGTDSGRTSARAYAVNETGTAVGTALKYTSGVGKGSRAVRWDASGIAATELDSLGTDSAGIANSEAIAINSVGTAVGYANKYDMGSSKGARAVRWDALGTIATELDNLGVDSNGSSISKAFALNDAGRAVGYAQKFDGTSYRGDRAVRWDASSTTATELGNLGTDGAGNTDSEALAINSAGTAVGYASKYVSGSPRGIRPVRWNASGTDAIELGNLGTDSGGRTAGGVYSINDSGIAVGNIGDYDAAGNYLGNRAVMWGIDGVAINLNTLIDPASGWSDLYYAASISNDNWITGVGTFDPGGPGGVNAYERLFLIHVPEPTAGLISVGILTLLCRRRLGAIH